MLNHFPVVIISVICDAHHGDIVLQVNQQHLDWFPYSFSDHVHQNLFSIISHTSLSCLAPSLSIAFHLLCSTPFASPQLEPNASSLLIIGLLVSDFMEHICQWNCWVAGLSNCWVGDCMYTRRMVCPGSTISVGARTSIPVDCLCPTSWNISVSGTVE